MPWYDDWDEPPEAPSLEEILWDFDSPHWDPTAHDMWMEGVAHDNRQAYDDLVDYLDWMYGIDFEQEFDWDKYPG